MKQRDKTVAIRQYIIDNLERHPTDLVARTAQMFRMTRQAVLHHINAMIGDGTLKGTGNTRARRYELCPIAGEKFFVDVSRDLAEDVLWRERISPLIGTEVPRNVVEIAQYGFTEMINNVVDHSQSDRLLVDFRYTPQNIAIRIADFGVGIFKKIMTELKLPDEVAAICELAKGKVTTDPEHHTGEGVFFTSRLFDYFCLMSGSLYFSHTLPDNDWLIEDRDDPTDGTYVAMTVGLRCQRTCADVYNQFASPEEFDLTFSRTHVPIMLMQYGQENLVSRSQAKRLLTRFDRFSEVLLDFSQVDFIGQAFADEIFRVFQKAHPDVKLIPINATEQVRKVIAHVQAPPRVLDSAPRITRRESHP